jgi:hypothetical protein
MPRLIFLPAIALLLWNCASTVPKQSCTPEDRYYLQSSNCTEISGFADVEVCRNGEKQRALLTIKTTQKSFAGDIHAPLGMLIASIEADQESVVVDAAQFHTTIARNQILAANPFFLFIPISFDEFERIISGRVPRSGKSDFHVQTRERKGFFLRSTGETDSARMIISARSGSGRIVSVEYEKMGVRPWRCVLRKIKNGLSHEIYFEVDEKNYFLISYHRLICSGMS